MKERQLWLQNTRAVATISVIILHTSAPIVYSYGEIPIQYWHIGNTFDSMVRFAVPVFFMISGALLLRKDYTLNKFLKLRFLRLIPPFLFWSLVYIICDTFIFEENSYSVKEFGILLIDRILNGSKFHLWFVYTLIGIYLFTPILRKWIKHSSKKEIHYFLLIWLITILYGIPVLKNYLPQVNFLQFSGFIGYFVLGYYLSTINLKNKYLPLICLLTGIIITLFGTYYITKEVGQFSNHFYDYLTPNIIMASTGIFLLLKNISIESYHIKNLFYVTSKYSYGIYLIHILVLTIIRDSELFIYLNPIIKIPTVSIVCFIASLLIISLLNKMKFGYYISG